MAKSVRVSVIMGSDSDLPVMRAASDLLAELDVGCETTIVSAHRTPDRMVEYAKRARERGIGVIVAGAGGAAHLPGMVAAMTTLPVIGVPVRTSSLSGLDSLLSIVQMPRGVPVATVAINNATNAALLAARILSVGDDALAARLEKRFDDSRQGVESTAAELEQLGVAEFLKRRDAG